MKRSPGQSQPYASFVQRHADKGHPPTPYNAVPYPALIVFMAPLWGQEKGGRRYGGSRTRMEWR
jgi:hypothetical protein